MLWAERYKQASKTIGDNMFVLVRLYLQWIEDIKYDHLEHWIV